MKKILQFSGVISAVLAAVAFILMMATNAIIFDTNYVKLSPISGVHAIFGNADHLFSKPSALALIAWILVLLGFVVACVGAILPLLNVKKIEKFAGVMNLCVVVCLVLAGIFMFLVVPTFFGANEVDVPDSAKIGAGWVIGGILAIAAGAFAILPAAVDFVGKKRK